MKVGDVIEVEWDDHVFQFGEYTNASPGIVRARTVGYLVSDDDEAIVLALTLSEGRPHDTQTIDKRMLREYRRVSKGRRVR